MIIRPLGAPHVRRTGASRAYRDAEGDSRDWVPPPRIQRQSIRSLRASLGCKTGLSLRQLPDLLHGVRHVFRASAAPTRAAWPSAHTAVGIQGNMRLVRSMVLLGAMPGAITDRGDVIPRRCFWLRELEGLETRRGLRPPEAAGVHTNAGRQGKRERQETPHDLHGLTPSWSYRP
jgi:hypothetical protein